MILKPAILVVDDDSVALSLLAEIVEKAQYQVFRAPHGEEALQILRGRPIDLVLSDYEMPVLDGLNLLKQVKQEFPRLPFIMITALSNLGVVREAWQYGAFDFFQKPIFVDRLHQTMRFAIEYGHLSIARRKSQDANPSQPDEKMLDVGVIRELAAGSERESVLHAVDEYETFARIELEQLLRFAMIKDATQVCSIAHRLAGTSTTFGLTFLTRLLRKIESEPDQPIADPSQLAWVLESSIHILKHNLTQIFESKAS